MRELLDAEEVVTAEDYEVEAGSSFDVKSDFSGLGINDEKVRVTFHEAKNEAGQDFDGNYADTYRAVYFVEPLSGHPSYHICRNIIVKEPVTEKQSESHSDGGGTGEESAEPESEDEDAEPQPQTETEAATETDTETVTELPEETEILSEEDLDAALEETEAAFRERLGTKVHKDGEERTIPAVTEGQTFHPVTASISEHYTTPPKPYSEDTLLSAMETAGNQEFDEETEKKGLGTPATRASIIEKLVSSGYAVRKGKQLFATQDGADLISVLPEYLRSAAMTAEWENRLLRIEKGELCGQEFLEGIVELIDRMLLECGKISVEEQTRFYFRESIGTCPVCGSPVYESKRNFFCGNRECGFSLWKENRYLSGMKKMIDKKMAAELLKDGRTYVPDLYSQKKGRTFAAYLILEAADGKAAFRLEFPKKKK